MKVNYALILAAGAGTRMGEIGKRVPKVLWPIFEKSILELEVLYAKKLGIEKIFINTFHYKDKIKEFYKNSTILQEAELVEENEILDIGGAVHNLAKMLDYHGKLMIFNSDQFIFLSDDNWKKAFELLKDMDHLIFSYNVSSNDMYNALVIDKKRLVNITKNEEIVRDKVIQTYTGMSIINLSRLNRVEGKSNFFESVASFKTSDIGVFNIKDSVYWDFGTLVRYENSMFSILEKFKSNDPFIEFLKEKNAIESKKVDSKILSYDSKAKKCINLSGKDFECENCILLKETNYTEISNNMKIIYDDIIFEF